MWCVLHIASLAIKWGMAPLIPRKELIEDVHIVIKSLRNGSDSLFSVVPLFLVSQMRYRRAAEQEQDMHRGFWCLGGVNPDFMDTLMKVDPWWDVDEEILWVDHLLEDDPTKYDTATPIIYYFFNG